MLHIRLATWQNLFCEFLACSKKLYAFLNCKVFFFFACDTTRNISLQSEQGES